MNKPPKLSSLSITSLHMNSASINNFQQWLDRADAASHSKDKVSWVNTLLLTPHVEETGETVLIPQDQIPTTPEGFSLLTLNADNQTSIPTNFTTAGQMVQFKITRNTVNYLNNISIIWTLAAATADVIIPPLPFLLDRIEFWGNGVNGDKIQTLYPEVMFATDQIFYADEQKVRQGRYKNFNNINGFDQNTITSGTTVRYLADMRGNFVEVTHGLYVPALLDDSFYVKLYLATDPRVRFGASGTGTLSITNVQLQLEVAELPESDMAEIRRSYTSIIEKDFLDTVKQSWPSWTLTVGTNNRNQLTALSGWCSWIMLLIRATGTLTYTTNSGFNGYGHLGTLFQTYDLGDTYNGATLSIENTANQIISAQSAIPAEYFQTKWSQSMLPGRFTEFFRNWYVFAFGDVAAAEQRGIRKGLALFSTNEWLNIWPQSSPTAETAMVLTLTAALGTTGAAQTLTGGNYQLTYRGKVTDVLAYNSTLAAIQAQIDYIFDGTIGFDGTPIICKVGGALLSAASTGITFTFSNLPGPKIPTVQGDLLSVVGWNAFNATPAYCGPAMTTTTAAVMKKGLSTGNYQVDAFARMYRHVHIRSGRFMVSGFSI